jgi:hypothetical protein
MLSKICIIHSQFKDPHIVNIWESSTRPVYGSVSLDALIPVSLPTNLLLFNKMLRISKTRMKSRGERGHPCRSPLSLWNALEASPLIKTARVAVVMQPIIQFVVAAPNPYWRRMRCRKSQLIQSKACLRSSFRRMAGMFFVFMLCKHSCAVPIASRICLPLRKPSCSSASARERRRRILLAMIFVIIL